MPAFNGVAAGHDTVEKKRSTEEIASGITTALLIVVIFVFVGASLWLGVFAIPAFFAFFRASVVTISSIREVRWCLGVCMDDIFNCRSPPLPAPPPPPLTSVPSKLVPLTFPLLNLETAVSGQTTLLDAVLSWVAHFVVCRASAYISYGYVSAYFL